jgi:phosphomevalonate kinase
VTRATCPGKLVVAGAFAVLEGDPGVAVAVGPRLSLELAPGTWPAGDPFARAARVALGGDPDRPPPLSPRGAFPVPVAGFSLGSSAAWTTALVAALATADGRALAGSDLFRAARRAHRAAQGGEGSGLDVAACCLGGAVSLRGASGDGDPELRAWPWPAWVEVVVVRAGVAGSTPDRIRAWRAGASRGPSSLRESVVQGVVALEAALAAGQGVLEALTGAGWREAEWLAAVAPGLACPILADVARAAGSLGPAVAVRSLGAGDAAGVFLDARRVSAEQVLHLVSATGLPALAVRPEAVGCRVEAV